MKDVEVIQVVRTNIARRGHGTEGDPVRILTQFWSFDGTLLAEADPHKSNLDFPKNEHTPRDCA